MDKAKEDPVELTKYGVACQCAKGDRPAKAELVKIAGVFGKLRCPCCGADWIDLDEISSQKQS